MVSLDLLLSTRDDATQQAVRQVLEAEGADSRLQCVQDWSELDSQLSHSSRNGGVGLALVDLEREPMEALGKVRSVVRRARRTPFVFVCDELRTDLVLEAMQIGARHCLLRSSISSDLPPLLARLQEDARADVSSTTGRAITVIGAGGGCGATTLSINLAEELRLLRDSEVMLIDMDRFNGTMAAYLGAECEYGISDVLTSKRTIDTDLIRSTSTPCGQDLHLLASPASIDFGSLANLPLENFEKVLAACALAFPWTVIDGHRLDAGSAAQLAQASAATLVVFQLSVVDIRIARSLITALVDRGVPQERIRPVVNRYHKRRTLVRLEDAAEALGMEPYQLPNDYASAIRALDLGQPLARVAPRSPLRKSMRDLAAQLDAPDAAEAADLR